MPHLPSPTAKKNIPAMLADTDFLFRQARQGADTFLQAQPFPHLLLPSFIKPICCAALHEGLLFSGMACETMPSIVRMLLWELSSSTLIRHLAALTGKPPLLPDPFLVHAGARTFPHHETVHVAEQEFLARHPETQLQNVLRLEVFVSAKPGATFEVELLDKRGHLAVSYHASSGSVLLVNSDDYHLRYRHENHAKNPALWRSLITYYYINDRARVLNGEEQPCDTY